MEIKKSGLFLLLLVATTIIPITVALAYNVDGEVKYFYAYHWEDDGLVGVNVRCKVDLDKISGDDPDWVKFRYGFMISAKKGGLDKSEQKDRYVVTEWQFMSWVGDGLYDNWWNWIPDDPSQAEMAYRVYVDIYVSDNRNEDTSGDWVCDDVTIIEEDPPKK